MCGNGVVFKGWWVSWLVAWLVSVELTKPSGEKVVLGPMMQSACRNIVASVKHISKTTIETL